MEPLAPAKHQAKNRGTGPRGSHRDQQRGRGLGAPHPCSSRGSGGAMGRWHVGGGIPDAACGLELRPQGTHRTHLGLMYQ